MALAGAIDKRISGDTHVIALAVRPTAGVSAKLRPELISWLNTMITKNTEIKKTDRAACSLCLANSTINNGGTINDRTKSATVSGDQDSVNLEQIQVDFTHSLHA